MSDAIGTNPADGAISVRTSLPAKKIHPVKIGSDRITRDEALNFVEYGKRIEGAEFRFEAVGFEPDGVTVGLAGLRSARLAQISGDARFAERNQRAHLLANGFSKADDDFEIGFDTGAVQKLCGRVAHLRRCL